MSAPRLHYDDWDGGTEADTDHPDTLFCGAGAGAPQLTTSPDQVTCKRCLKMLAAGKSSRLLEAQAQKARLYDDALAIVDNLGHENIVTALRCLMIEVETLRLDAMRYQVLRQADVDTIQNGGLFAGLVPDNKVINGVDLDEQADAVILTRQVVATWLN